MNFIRKYILLILVIFLFSCERNGEIEGKWYVQKFEKSNGEINKSSEKWVEFFKDGTLRGGKNGEPEIKSGIWKYDSIKKTLIIESKKEYGDEGIYILQSLTKNKMILLKDSIKVFFKR